MAEFREQQDERGELNPGSLAATAMCVGAALLALATVVWLIVGFWSLPQLSLPAAHRVAWGTGLVLAALAAGALALLLWGAAQILRRLSDLADQPRNAGNATTYGYAIPRPRVDQAGGNEQAELLQHLVQATRELRDIALLSEHERNMRARAESAALAKQLELDVPALLREHNWQDARARVQRARLRFPSLSNWDALDEQVEQARAKFEAHDIETATREINDLAALAAWDRAAEVVRDLQRRHPNSERVGELARRVTMGQDKAIAEERARLMSRAQAATDQHNWTEALRWVQEVIQKYPNSAETHDLRLQLPTLRANSEIQVRQQLEAEIRDLIRDQRYADALRRARQVIADYPDSPQAQVLREQLPKLEQRAAEAR
jgi:outer membrane protein assembly factor BamD (BamD/ComL family)